MSFRSATVCACGSTFPWPSIRPPHLAGYVGLPAGKTNAAAGLMNFMRNIGQSVGTSAVTTLIGPAQSVSSIRAGGLHRFRPVSRRYYSTHDAPDDCRLERACRSTTGTSPNVRAGSVPGRGSLLREVYWLLAIASALCLSPHFC